MKCWVIILFLLGVSAAETSAQEQSATLDSDRQPIAQSKTCILSVPKDWGPIADPTGRTVISVGNLTKNQFLSVVSVAKEDFHGSIADFLNQALVEVGPYIEDRSIGQPAVISLGGLPGEQVRITGTQNRFKFIYFLTSET